MGLPKRQREGRHRYASSLQQNQVQFSLAH